MSEKNISLSIETAVQGGSLSLFQDASEIDFQIGTRGILNSEGVLEEIKIILERNGVGKNSIKKIVVSRGPGSYTGVRVGMAVGFGLKKALGCEMVGMSTLEALLLIGKMENIEDGEVITAVPIGRNQVCWQNFEMNNWEIAGSQVSPKFSTISDFLNFCDKSKFQSKKMIVHRKLYLEIRENYKKRPDENIRMIDAGENIAGLIGMEAVKLNGKEIFQPIYTMAV